MDWSRRGKADDELFQCPFDAALNCGEERELREGPVVNDRAGQAPVKGTVCGNRFQGDDQIPLKPARYHMRLRVPFTVKLRRDILAEPDDDCVR